VAEAQLIEPLPHLLREVRHDGARRLATDLQLSNPSGLELGQDPEHFALFTTVAPGAAQTRTQPAGQKAKAHMVAHPVGVRLVLWPDPGVSLALYPGFCLATRRVGGTAGEGGGSPLERGLERDDVSSQFKSGDVSPHSKRQGRDRRGEDE